MPKYKKSVLIRADQTFENLIKEDQEKCLQKLGMRPTSRQLTERYTKILKKRFLIFDDDYTDFTF